MATFVNNLRLKEIGTGESSGTWGNETNLNLELTGEALGFGTEAITTNADTHTTTVADGSSDPGRAIYLKYTGTLDSACTITIGPNTISRLHFIENGTSGSQNIIISQGTGANVTIPPGDTKAIYLDGAGSGAAVVDAFASLNTVDLKVEDDLTVTDDASVGGDLLVSGEVQTANIGFTDGDNAITIADGGGITAANGITSTAAANTFGATSFNDANITNVGDIALDSLSADGSSISIASPVVINGSTPTLTIGDAGAEDTKLVFDGNAQDFYVGLDDSADDLIIGKGSTVGTTPAIIIDENLKVGIGAVSPQTNFHARTQESTSDHNAGGGFNLTGNSTAGSRKVELFLDADGGNFSTTSDGAYAYFEKTGDGGDFKIINQDSANIIVSTGGSEKARIDGSGNVGIGLTNASAFAKLTVSSTGNLLGLNATSGKGYQAFFEGGTGRFYFGTLNGSDGLDFLDADGATVRQRIHDSGQISIGTTTAFTDGSENSGTGSLHIAKNAARCLHLKRAGSNGEVVAFYRGGVSSEVGNISVSTSTTAFNTSSDYRLKENVNYEFDALSRVAQLKPARFNFIVEKDKTVDGFLAHEVSSVVPEAITGEKDAVDGEGNALYQCIDQSKLVPLLTKAIQELEARVKTLEG